MSLFGQGPRHPPCRLYTPHRLPLHENPCKSTPTLACPHRPRNYHSVNLHEASAILALASLSACSRPAPDASWHLIQGPEGPVWRADSGPWRAEVEPARARLSYLGPREGPNLLNRPPGPPSPAEMGGHRVWLGPQTEWPAMWPPPSHWEFEPAARVLSQPQGLLEIATPPGNPQAPELLRTYQWKNNQLVCGVFWQEQSATGRQAIHILQIRADATVRARPHPHASPAYVRLPLSSRPTTETTFPTPPHILSQQNGEFTLIRRDKEEKLGFPVQPLHAAFPGLEIILHPGRWIGIESGDPDHGFRSHVYLGPHDWPVLEIEQLSPRLTPARPGTTVGHEIIIELRRP